MLGTTFHQQPSRQTELPTQFMHVEYGKNCCVTRSRSCLPSFFCTLLCSLGANLCNAYPRTEIGNEYLRSENDCKELVAGVFPPFFNFPFSSVSVRLTVRPTGRGCYEFYVTDKITTLHGKVGDVFPHHCGVRLVCQKRRKYSVAPCASTFPAM